MVMSCPLTTESVGGERGDKHQQSAISKFKIKKPQTPGNFISLFNREKKSVKNEQPRSRRPRMLKLKSKRRKLRRRPRPRKIARKRKRSVIRSVILNPVS